jgi:predicted esterase
MRNGTHPCWAFRTSLGLILTGFLFFCEGAHGDLIVFKDGFVQQGKVRRESVSEWDPVGRDLLIIPKGFYMLDDGPRRVYFAPSYARIVEEKAPPSEERIFLKSNARFLLTSKNRSMPPILDVLEASPWDQKWEREYTYQSEIRRIKIPQHLSVLTPSFARVDATARYWWSSFYLTSEWGPDTVQKLIDSHPEFQYDDEKLDATDKLARRLRASDFFAQAGWFDHAQKQLELLLAEQPGEKKRVDALLAALDRMRAREQFEKIKQLHNAGRHQAVRRAIEAFPRKNASDEILAGLRELQDLYEENARQLKDAERYLRDLPGQASGAHAAILAEAARVIRGELHFHNIDRLEAFLSQARQAERLKQQGKKVDLGPDQLLALGVSGWLLNSPSAQPDPTFSTLLWQARELVLAYLNTPDQQARQQLLADFEKKQGKGGPTLDEIMYMIPLLPPAAPATKGEPGRPVRREVASRRFGTIHYHLELPPEYSPSRPYPVILALPRSGQDPADLLDRWKQASEEGYILAVPEWEAGISKNYQYTEREHDTVLETLRDLQQHFQVDSDRVFLFGFGEGGDMAFDVGLAYPDLFAGVLTMGGLPHFFSSACWRNGQYLPFYVVHGTRISTLKKRLRNQFDNWLRRGYPMLWIEYKGRGLEWYRGEIPYMLDWMRNKERAFPLRRLGSDGLGGPLGNEFCVMRQGPRRFYWLEGDEVDVRRINTVTHWNLSTRGATLHGRIDPNTNTIYLKPVGFGKLTVWLGSNRHGESMLDFSRPVMVRIGLGYYRRFPALKPSLSALLEDLYRRGDRQRLFLGKLELSLRR